MIKGLLTLGIVAAILLAAWGVETWFDRYRPRTGAALRCLVILVLAFLIGIVFVRLAHGRDFGQWEAADPAIREWYQSLMQPDNPAASCCGEADAYWADSFEVDGDRYIAVITDPRPDEPLRRKHIDIGTKIVIPNTKIKWNEGNPTAHGIVFLSRGDYVYCYLPPGGV
jgi:hypothetical protein